MAFVFGVSQRAAGADYQVFLLGGQSNMRGMALGDNLPSELQTPQSDVLFHDSYSLGPLKPRSFDGLFGPEITFGRTIADAWPDANFALVKYAYGASNLHTHWDPNTGEKYQEFRSRVATGLAAIQSRGHTTEIVGMLWMQGETDAINSRTAAQYQADQIEFIADVRARYGDNLPFFMGQLSSNQLPGLAARFAQIRQAQAAVASSDANTYMIDTSPFALQSDDLHFNADGQQALGRAYAQAYIASIPAPGDTDGDRDVDEFDYNNLVAQFGGSPGSDSADFNGDQRVDLDDFAIMRMNFSSGGDASSPGPELAADAPEPATLTLTLISAMILLNKPAPKARRI